VCGRFTSTTAASDLAAYFETEGEVVDLGENHNVTPTSDIHVVREDTDGRRRLDIMFWGLVPQWAESPAIGSRMINARSETVATKPSFRAAFRRRRCLIPVDGFYEWVPISGHRRKQPMFITSRSREPLALAGLWETWRPIDASADEPPLRSCTIITGEPNALVAPLHDRMPVILDRGTWDSWLDPANDDIEALQSMLLPAPEELLEYWPVSTDVNDVRMNGPRLIDAVEPVTGPLPPEQSTLL
jgi:putative SOS response-associated peptidase YedK